MKRTVPRGFVVLISFSLVFLLMYTAFSSLLHSEKTYLNVKAELREENALVLSYLTGPFFGENTLSFLNNSERSHMTDVKRLLDVAFVIYLISLGILVGVAVVLVYHKMRDYSDELLARSLKVSGWAILGFCVFAALSSLLDFQKFWALFHAVFFPQGNWMFPEGSILIQMYPIEFFQNFVTRWLIRIGLFGAFAVIMSSFIIRMRESEHFFSKVQKGHGKNRKR